MKDRLADLQKAKGIVIEVDDSTEFHELYPSTIEVGVRSDVKMSKIEQSLSKFLSEMNAVHADVRRIEALVVEVRRRHADTLLCAGTSEEHTALNEQLHDAMTEIRTLSRAVKNRLAELQARCAWENKNAVDGGRDFTAEMRIRESQCSTLSKKFIDIMKEYMTEQANYKDGCKKRLTRQLNIMDVNLEDEEFDKMIETGNFTTFHQNILADAEVAKKALEDIQERHVHLIEVEASIRELHDMFVDLAMLVESQGESIDRIDLNVERAMHDVTRGNEDIRKTRQLQIGARRKKICLAYFLISLSLVLLLFVILYITEPSVGGFL